MCLSLTKCLPFSHSVSSPYCKFPCQPLPAGGPAQTPIFMTGPRLQLHHRSQPATACLALHYTTLYSMPCTNYTSLHYPTLHNRSQPATACLAPHYTTLYIYSVVQCGARHAVAGCDLLCSVGQCSEVQLVQGMLYSVVQCSARHAVAGCDLWCNCSLGPVMNMGVWAGPPAGRGWQGNLQYGELTLWEKGKHFVSDRHICAYFISFPMQLKTVDKISSQNIV